ncbi:MAG TPA: hypothetical protein VN081_00140 [Dongiaceae bacterium]|nr:hypothetical protein [Dongiaceae bacterium]
MAKIKLDVLAVNVKGGSNSAPVRFIAWLRRRKAIGVPLVVGMTEADGLIVPYLQALTKFGWGGLHRGHGTHGAREVALQHLGRQFKVTSVEHHKLTDNVNPPGPDHDYAGDGQDRHCTMVRATVSKKVQVTVFSVHAPTSTRSGGDWTNTAGAREWRYHGRPKLASLIREEIAAGRQVIVTGDFNEVLTRVSSGTGEWAKNLGLKVFVVDVMWIMVSHGPLKPVKRTILNRAPGCDHPHEIKLRLATR